MTWNFKTLSAPTLGPPRPLNDSPGGVAVRAARITGFYSLAASVVIAGASLLLPDAEASAANTRRILVPSDLPAAFEPIDGLDREMSSIVREIMLAYREDLETLARS